MERVIRICAITGRMTVVADDLTTEQAKNLVIAKSREDEFSTYLRIIKSF